MYRCDADGSDIRRISAGVEHENTPWMLPDGRLLYTRWEYVNRSEKAYHHLWVINPDGTAQMVYYGNGAIRGNVMIDAKPIPGGNRIVSVFSMGHGITEHRGKLMVIDPDAGPDSPSAARRLDSGFPGPEQKRNMTYTWRDPYAISEDCFLVASHDGLYVMDGQGRYERIHRLPAEVQNDLGRIALHEPRPLRARRRELTIPSRVDWGAEHGTFVLSDVTVGRNMSGVEPDTVKKLLILEELPKPVSVCWNKDSVSLFTTYMLHRIVGTVPVQPDGSAHFNAPALRPLFFIALDKDNRPVQRMQSFVSVMPGETVSCVGCHEPRTHTPPVMDRNMPLAATREPDAIDPVSGVPDVMDYRRDVQPVWNKHCTGCHNYDKYAGELVLTDDLGPRFANSYMFLHKRGQMWYPSSRGQNPPYKTGSEASKLYQVLKAGHKKVRLSEGEMKTIRLWIEASSHYAGTYAALGSAKNDELVMDFDRDVLKKRCYRCHLDERALRKIAAGKTAHWLRGRGEGYTVNISNPLTSLLLLAPLSKDDGGLGLCRDKTTRREDRHRKAPRIDIFADRNDPDYQQLEKVLTAYGRAQMVNPRQWGTPAWQPPDYYIGEMKRYGVLPDNWQATDKTDWFEIDKRYYRTIDE
jgi:hypothetical protein